MLLVAAVLVHILLIVPAGATGVEDRLWFLEQAMVRAQTKVEAYGAIFEGAVMLFHDRTSCPNGWEPATHLNNRFPLISHGDVGSVSNHTTEHPPRILKSDCTHSIRVRDDGGIKTCREMPTSFLAKDAVPYASLLACIKSSV